MTHVLVVRERSIRTVAESRLLQAKMNKSCIILPDVSPTTVEAVLGKMVKEGLIETIGNGRNTKYRKK